MIGVMLGYHQVIGSVFGCFTLSPKLSSEIYNVGQDWVLARHLSYH
jgi:hypothetical protein